MGLPYHHRHARLDDARLFKCNLRQCFAQHIAVVKTYICYYTEYRCDYVCTVQTTSKPSLQNHDINVFVRKPLKRHDRGYFKEGQVKMVEGISPPFNEIPDILL